MNSNLTLVTPRGKLHTVIDQPSVKQCTICLERKPLTEFYATFPSSYYAASKAARASWTGLRVMRSFCRPCFLRRHKTYITPEKESALAEKRYLADPRLFRAKTMLHRARRRSRTFKVPYNLTLPYLLSIMPTHCPVFGKPFFFGAYGDDAAPESPSLDRFHADRGYVVGNVHVISRLANIMKNCGTLEQVMQLSAWMQIVAVDEVSTDQLIQTLRALPT